MGQFEESEQRKLQGDCAKCDACMHRVGCKDKSDATNCLNFEYDCEQCKENGFKHYDCADCCLSEDEYFADESGTPFWD